MKRAKTWAVVMNSSVVDCGLTTSLIATAALRQVSTKFEWVRMQPLGTPVDPDV